MSTKMTVAHLHALVLSQGLQIDALELRMADVESRLKVRPAPAPSSPEIESSSEHKPGWIACGKCSRGKERVFHASIAQVRACCSK